MDKNELLLYMCRRTAAIPCGYDPNIYSIPSLSKNLRETQYRIRKWMKELEADGAVAKTYDGCIDEDGYPRCYHGWSITEQTVKSDMYKQCYKEAIDEYQHWIEGIEKK